MGMTSGGGNAGGIGAMLMPAMIAAIGSGPNSDVKKGATAAAPLVGAAGVMKKPGIADDPFAKMFLAGGMPGLSKTLLGA